MLKWRVQFQTEFPKAVIQCHHFSTAGIKPIFQLCPFCWVLQLAHFFMSSAVPSLSAFSAAPWAAATRAAHTSVPPPAHLVPACSDLTLAISIESSLTCRDWTCSSLSRLGLSLLLLCPFFILKASLVTIFDPAVFFHRSAFPQVQVVTVLFWWGHPSPVFAKQDTPLDQLFLLTAGE